MTAFSAIDMTPLIDLAFSLLIIFMISAPLLEQAIDLQLPTEESKPQRPTPPPRVQSISIDAAGTVFWGREAVTTEQLDRRLEEIAAEPEPPIIQLRADATLPYQRVVDLLDRVKHYKLERLDLATQAR